MGAIWYRARAEMRARWRALAALALLVGVVGGAVLAAAAGARRTQTAYPRLLEATNAHDALLSGGAFTALHSGFYEAAAALPEVESSGLLWGVGFVAPRRPDLAQGLGGRTLAALDPALLTTIDRPKLLQGRMPGPEATDEVIANEAFAKATGVAPGERFEVRQSSDSGPVGSPFMIEVVGIAATATDLLPVANLDEAPGLYLPAAFTRAHIAVDQRQFEALAVNLRPGTDVAAFERKVRDLIEVYPKAGDLFFASEAGRPAVVARALRPQVLALVAFAAMAGFTMLLVIGQALTQQARLDADDNPSLGALGMSQTQLFALGLVRTCATVAAGATIAIAIAVAASPLMPIGPARRAEPDPGIQVHGGVLGIGGAAIVLALVGITVLPLWRAARAGGRADAPKPSSIAGAVSRAFDRPSASIGVRLALDPGRGRSAVPVRATLAEVVIAISAVVATFTFGSSLDGLLATPRLYGQDWDILSDTQFGVVPRPLVELARTDASIDAATGGVYGVLNLSGEVVPAVGLDLLRGSAFPTLLEGRAPEAPDEVVLGSSTLRRLGVRVGGRVEEGDAGMTVVGRAVFPRLGQGSFTPTSLGEGAAVSTERLVGLGLGPGEYTFLLIRTRGGPSAALARALSDLCALAAELQNTCAPSQRPADIENYAAMRDTPHVLTGILAMLALSSLVHALVASVTRRRRDLAVLKTLGFARRQVSGAVAWQATTLTVVALVVGLPLGIVAGRWGWIEFAGQLGVFPEARTPVVTLLALVAAAVALANVVAALPGRAAARTRVAEVLRTE